VDVADELELLGRPEDGLRADLAEQRPERFHPHRAHHARGREVDAHARAVVPRGTRRRERGVAHRRARKPVRRQMELRTATQPGGVELVGPELRCDAAVGQHRPAAARVGERDDRPGSRLDLRPEDLDAAARELLGQDPSCGIAGALADEAGGCAERRGPGGNVRGLTAGRDARATVRVGVARDGSVDADDDVEKEVAERAEHDGEPTIGAWTPNGAGD
jgi:hypothetical protein